MTQRSRLIGSLLVLTSLGIPTFADNLGLDHPVETTGVRPMRNWEPISGLSPKDRYRVAATAVGEIVLELADGEQLQACTGTVVSPTLVLTARHCLEVVDPATQVVEQLQPKAIKFELNYLTYGEKPDVYNVNLKPVEIGKGDLDYMLLRIDSEFSLKSIRVPNYGNDPVPSQSLYIIHHPSGQALQISRQFCKATDTPESDDFLQHVCDTMPSSSGAPIFNDDLAIVAVHVRGGKSETPGTFNEGVLISKILANSPVLKKAIEDFGGKGDTQNISVTAKVQVKFQLADGRVFQKSDDGWLLSGDANGATHPLKQQRSSETEMVLWDPSQDVIYEFPFSGGIVRSKKLPDAVWHEEGNAQKM